MGMLGDFGKLLLGGASGALSGGLPGAVLGLFGGGGSSSPVSRTAVDLRALTKGERGLFNDSLAGLRGLGSGPYSQDIFDALYRPAADDTSRAFARERGRTDFMFKSTGGGPSSVRNQASRNSAGEESRALAALRGSTAGTAAGLTSNLRRDLLGAYSTILSGQNVGAGQSTYFPQDNTNSLLSLGMDALINKDSWWNKGGSDWLSRLFGGGSRATATGVPLVGMPKLSLPPIDTRLLGQAVNY